MVWCAGPVPLLGVGQEQLPSWLGVAFARPHHSTCTCNAPPNCPSRVHRASPHVGPPPTLSFAPDTYTHICTHTSTHTTHARTRAHTSTRAHTHTHTHAHTHARTHAHTHTPTPQEVFYYQLMGVNDFRNDVILAEACRGNVDN